jgi:signal transduction histidine kinase
MIAGIQDGSDRIRGIIDRLKEFVRQGTSTLEGRVDCNTVVSFSVTIMRHLISRHTRNFSMELSEGLPLVRGNTHLLEQVVINLLMNALQALPDPDRGVWVTTGHDPEARTVTISVRDEGCGIPEAIAQRIHEPFFTTKLDNGGSGLGLSISQTIVKEHGGTLEFRSTPGRGTIFTVSLPQLPINEGVDHES